MFSSGNAHSIAQLVGSEDINAIPTCNRVTAGFYKGQKYGMILLE